MAAEADVKKSDIPMFPVKKGHTTVWHLVSKMQAAAAAEGFECSINAYSLNEMNTYGPGADIILLGPQVRYQQDKVKTAFPGKPVAVIDMKLYGMMKGKEVLEEAKKLMQ